ncbi:MAG: hypothetical protein GVY33_05905 [Alphaproteobacteria bacterium]|nr:hypothetical protein [Alphaproteobacteria bacterium]
MLLRLLALLAGLLLVPLALVALLLALLQSEGARAWAEAAVDRWVPGVRIDGLGPGLPARLDLARLDVADDAGVWLTLEDVDVRWSPLALLGGRLEVERIAARRLALARTPVAAPPAEEAEAPAEPGEPFRLPEAIPPVRVGTLAVDRIELAAPVLGEAAVFDLAGRLDAASGTAAALDLRLTRLDREGLEATIDAALDLAGRRLDLRLAADERSGLLTALTGEPDLAPFGIELAGAGPLADWPGTLQVEIGALATLDADLDLALEDAPRIALDGRIRPGPALAATPYAPLVADGVDLALTAARPGTDLVVERLRVATDAVALAGKAALRGETATVNLDLDAPELAAFAPLTATELGGRARLTVALDGPLPLPPGTVRIVADDLRAAGIRVAAVDQRLELRPGGDRAVSFDAAGEVAGIEIPAGAATFREDVTLAAAGSVTPGGPFALDDLAVDGRSVRLEAEATGDLDAGTLDLTTRLRAPELAAFRPFSPAVPTGAFELALTAALDDGFATGDLTLDGGGRDLAELPPAAQALLGAAPTLDAAVRLDGADAPLALERLRVEGAGVAFTGDGTFDPAAGRGELAAQLRLPALAPVGEALGQPLAGAIALDLEAAGGPDAVDGEAVLTADGLAAAGQTFDRVRVALTATGPLSRLAGALDAAARKPAGEVSLVGDYVLDGERLALDGVRLAAPGFALDGGVDVALAPLALDGRLAGGSDDLAPLGRWLDLPLAGAVDLALALAPRDDQSARLDAGLRDLEAAGVGIARLGLEATASGLLATPTLDVAAELVELDSGATVVERAELALAGGLDALALTVDAAGRLPQTFALAAAADLALAGAPTTVTLTRLDGTVEELPIRLRAPATLRMEDATLALDGLDLELDTGRLRGDATLGAERIEGLIELDGLRLERLDALGVPPLAGALATTLRLGGTRRAPVLDGDVALTELRPVDSAGEAAAFDLAWRLGGGALTATLASAGFGEPALGVEARLPVGFALEPFAVDLPDPLPLDVAVDGVLDLARVAGWYGLEGRVLKGRLVTDLAIAGTAVAPRLDGEVTLADGRYIDVATGVLLETLRAEVVGEGRRLVIREVAATDGADGRLRAEGTVDFAEAVPNFDVGARLRRFAVMQREALFILMSGDAAVTGAGADLDVRGDFTVEQGEIFLVGGEGAADFAALDVLERSALDETGDGETDEVGPGGTVDLDVRVRIPGRLFVRGRGLISEWQGGLEVMGTAAAPRIEGLIEYRRGHFDIFDRRFQLRRGEIRFAGASPPDPFLNVEAAVDLPRNTAILRVSGPALDPELEIASEPPLPEDEIFSRLLFDREQAQLNPLQAFRVAAAVRQLRGGGPDAFDRVRSLLGIDTLEVGGETMKDASVKVGTYVREDVFVEIERGLQAGTSGARVQIELTPRLNVETRVREDSTGSVGLRWSYDY